MRAFALLLMLFSVTARAAEPVDVVLVLVADVSRSIDDAEFQMQKKGYAAAFNDPRVLTAIRSGAIGAIAVAYVEFAGRYEVCTILNWHVVRDASSARAFTEAIIAANRSFYGGTSVSAGIDRAMQLLSRHPFEASRQVIDVAADGINTSGRNVSTARDEAVAAGVTVNGLAIIDKPPASTLQVQVQPVESLTEWFRRRVIGGPGAFVIEVHEFAAFGEAMTRKLVSEIASLPEPVRR